MKNIIKEFWSSGEGRIKYLGLSILTAGILSGCNTDEKIQQSPVQKDERPNVLFIAVDDLRTELGCLGDTAIKTPNIDRLAQRGVTFTHAYCQQAICNPSRASLLTGFRPDSIGVCDLYTNFRDNIPDLITLPQYFKNNDYYTTGIGKIYHNNIQDSISWHEKFHIDGFPFDPDAVYLTEENLRLVEEKKQRLIAKGYYERYIDEYGLWYIKTMSTEIADVEDNEYYDGAQTDFAIKKLAEFNKRDDPFFFAVGYYRPHLPFNAPRKYWDMYVRENIPLASNDFVPRNAPNFALNDAMELRRSYTDFHEAPSPFEGKFSEEQKRLLKHGYFASVSYTDAQIGRLLDALDSLGLTDNTIIVLWGDHGWKLGEHNSWCKQTNYEIDTRSPLIIIDPRMKEKNVKCDALVEFVDIYPTLCDLTGLDIPESLHGISMKPLMENPGKEWKSAIFTQHLRGKYRKLPDNELIMGRAIRTVRYRYVEWKNYVTGKLMGQELYDLQADPQENESIAGFDESKELIRELSDRLQAGWREAVPANK
ncbi:sulfatase [Bacteroidota bacterium]